MMGKPSQVIGLIVSILAGIIGLILLGKVLVAIAGVSLRLADWFIAVLSLVMQLAQVCITILSFIGTIGLTFLLLTWLLTKISSQLSELSSKFASAAKNDIENLLPILIACVSEVSILLLSKDFAPWDTKMFLSFILLIVLGIISLTTSRKKNGIWGVIAVCLILSLAVILLFLRHDISDYQSFTVFWHTRWQNLVALPIIDLLTIELIFLSFLCLFGLAIYYGFKTA